MVLIVTPTPRIVIITNTPLPSSTPDLDAPQVWETPPSEVLLNYDPTRVRYLPPPAQFTETVAERKFQFIDPPGFRFRNTTTQSVMENSDESIMFFLEFFEHNGKANAAGFLMQLLKNEQLYKAIDNPQTYSLSGYQGWIVNIESPNTYEHGLGQLIVIDVDASNLFYAIGIAKPDRWESEGKQIYDGILNSLTFRSTK
jgi:hypothetical protein